MKNKNPNLYGFCPIYVVLQELRKWAKARRLQARDEEGWVEH